MHLLESWAATWDEDDRIKFTGKYDHIFPYVVLALLYCLLQIFQLALFIFAMFLLNDFRYKREDCSMNYDRIVMASVVPLVPHQFSELSISSCIYFLLVWDSLSTTRFFLYLLIGATQRLQCKYQHIFLLPLPSNTCHRFNESRQNLIYICWKLRQLFRAGGTTLFFTN
jgi:hypothetical protein